MKKRINKRINLERIINKWRKWKINKEREEGEGLYRKIERLYWKIKRLSAKSCVVNEKREGIGGLWVILLSFP